MYAADQCLKVAAPVVGEDDTDGEHKRAPRTPSGAARAVALLFMHIQVAPLPSTKPPTKVEELRHAGTTAETLFDIIGQMATPDDVLVNVDARLEFTYLKRNHPILAPPLLVDSHIVKVAGAEYRGSNPWEPGLHTLRWSEGPQNTDVFASYGYPWQEDALDLPNRWKKEEAQCLSYIGKVL